MDLGMNLVGTPSSVSTSFYSIGDAEDDVLTSPGSSLRWILLYLCPSVFIWRFLFAPITSVQN
jgi:hypothetical protein